MSAVAAVEATSLLDVRDLTVHFPDPATGPIPAVDGVSFEIEAGEVLGLLGESGCGKTTTALALLGLLPASARLVAGSATFRGVELLGLDERRLQRIRGADISFLFQEPAIALNPVLRVGDQIAEVARAHRPWNRRRRKEEAEALLVALGLPDRAYGAYPHELSGGQRQRVAIAQAVVCRPSLMIADEPTTALDSLLKAEVLRLLVDLKERFGLALLMISHDLPSLAAVADRLLVMYAGRIVEEGPVASIYRQPLHPYTCGLLASVPGRRSDDPTAGRRSNMEADAAGTTGALAGLKHLSKTYVRQGGPFRRPDVVPAVIDVDLAIAPGSTFALVGGSGAGKSTLARCLARLEEPTSGEIWFEGRDLRALTGPQLVPVRRRIQLIFQDAASALNPRLTAAEIVAEPLLVAGRGTRQERNRRVRELMAQVGLAPGTADRRPFDLSGGQRQRLAIARALAAEPKLLALDEALAGLDLSIQAQIVNLLLDLQAARGLTYLFISHDLGLMARIADEIAVMYEGRIVEQASAAAILDRPRHPHTRALVSAAALAGIDRVPRSRDAPPPVVS